MGLRGPSPQDECIAGHDLTDPENVAIVKRKRGNTTYKERQCIKCRRRRCREWWHNNRKAA